MVRKICLIVGIVLLLYPCISRLFENKTAKDKSQRYEECIENLSKQNQDTIIREAKNYNQKMAEGRQSSDYQKQLNPLGNGVMGILNIPSIDVELPVFHGTEEDVLNHAVGHVCGTSLPIGGEDTHCVLAGHRGLPEAELFTRLGELKVGDVFSISVLGKTLFYKVCEIQTILPDETETLGIRKGRDFISLITCTPYGINTHRLVVTGERLEGKEG